MYIKREDADEEGVYWGVMNSSTRKDADRAKLHQRRSFKSKSFRNRFGGWLFVDPRKGSRKKKRTENKEINLNRANLNSKVLENGAKKMRRKLEEFWDQVHAKTHPEIQIGNLSSNWLKIWNFKIQFKKIHKLYQKIENQICEFLRQKSVKNSTQNPSK